MSRTWIRISSNGIYVAHLQAVTLESSWLSASLEAYHLYERVTSHIWTSHVTQMNESRHIYEQVMPQICTSPARPYESCKNISGLPPPRCPFETGTTVVQNKSMVHTISTRPWWSVEIKNPTRLSNKTCTAWFCAEDQILENKISGTGF